LKGKVSPDLSRERVTGAALALVQAEGLDGLSMRALADHLEVKAASLYWHVRDRAELLELLADAILARVPAREGGRRWRDSVRRICLDVEGAVTKQRDAARILLSAPEALDRSAVHTRLRGLFRSAGLTPGEAGATATMLLNHVLLQPAPREGVEVPKPGRVVSIAIDSGSRGVRLRAGAGMDTLYRVPRDRAAAAPAVVQREKVIVRRLRGTGEALIELNPGHPWRVQVQGATWNTNLDLRGLDVREVKLDSGAAKVDCTLPSAHGVVPLIVSGGVAGVGFHRPPGVDVVARVGSGAVKVRLDDFYIRAAIVDAHWSSRPDPSSSSRYDLSVSGGAVQVSLDESASQSGAETGDEPAAEKVSHSDAIEVLLDGVEARVGRR
jgi:AcrR family transcriptional regulator